MGVFENHRYFWLLRIKWRVTSIQQYTIQQYTLMFSDRWHYWLVNRSYFYPTFAWIPHEFLTSWLLALDLFISYSYFTDGAFSNARKWGGGIFKPKIWFLFLRYALICLLPHFWLLWLRDFEHFISYSYVTNGAFSNKLNLWEWNPGELLWVFSF